MTSVVSTKSNFCSKIVQDFFFCLPFAVFQTGCWKCLNLRGQIWLSQESLTGFQKLFCLGFLKAFVFKGSPLTYADSTHFWIRLIIWHAFVCWFMFFPRFACCDHKIVLHWCENQNKNNFVIMLCKSWRILGNLQKSTNNFMSNSG